MSYKRSRNQISDKRRTVINLRDGYICRYCGCRIDKSKEQMVALYRKHGIDETVIQFLSFWLRNYEDRVIKDSKMEWHMDHIKPISLGGFDWPLNLTLACEACNLEKSANIVDVKIPLWQHLFGIYLMVKLGDGLKIGDFL